MPVAVVTATDLIANLRLPQLTTDDPLLIALFGLPGSGKSTLARAVAERLELALLCTDEIRRRYQLPSGPATHDVMYAVAVTLLGRGIGLVWDGIHLAWRDRDRFRRYAALHRARCRIIYVTASDEAIQQRLAERLRTPAVDLPLGTFAITPEHFRRIAAYLEVPSPDEDVINVDLTGGLDHDLEWLIRQLTEAPA